MLIMPVNIAGIVCIWIIKKEFVFAYNIKELYNHKKNN